MLKTSKEKRIYNPSYRKYRAYKTAIVITFSYLKLNFFTKILGEQYYQNRIQDLHLKNAERVKKAILELKGLFVKIGQLISILSNVLPDEFREPLESLQDKIPPRDYEEVASNIQKEFGKSPAEIFTFFDKTPLAAASIGQVHRARIGQEEVVVKIQHSNIEVSSEADLVILKNLVALHSFFMDMKGLEHLYQQVKQMVQEELDYTREAESMQIIRENLEMQASLRIVIPEIFPEYCTSKVLVSRFCAGVNIGQVDQIDAWGVDKEDLATRVIQLFCKMILVDGYYQADPHPGNILVNKEGEIILLDYGAVARLSPQTKTAIPDLIEAIVRDDTEGIVTGLRKMGFIGSGRDAERVAEKLIDTFKKFLLEEVELNGIDFKEIKLKSGFGSLTSILSKIDLREVSDTIQIPKDYVLLYRTLILLTGVSFQIAPTVNPVDVIRPYIKENILEQQEGIKNLVLNTLKSQLTTVLSLPTDLHKFLKQTNRGETEVEIRYLDQGFQKLWWLGQMFLFGLSSMLLASVLWVFKTPIQDSAREGLPIVFAFVFLLFLRAWRRGGKIKS